MPKYRPLPDRFWEKVELIPFHTCWEWTAAKDAKGYGRIGINAHNVGLAHRVSYEINIGPIPDSLDLDHLCRNPGCVNPAHLEPVSRGENVRRGRAGYHTRGRHKAHCVQGHALTDENAYSQPGTTWRLCITCRKASKKRLDERRRAAKVE